MFKIKVPVIPNSPTATPMPDENMAEIILRQNKTLQIVENRIFDNSKIIYDQNYQNSQAYSPAFQRHMQEMAKLIVGNYSPDKKIVEVGCGKADFLKLLYEQDYKNLSGFDATYEGDWPVVKKRYLTLEDKELGADLLILRHTLEHIPNPMSFLKMLAEVNNYKGEILIEVPCFDWIKSNGTFFDITYEHVNYFNIESLKKLFKGKAVDTGRVFGNQYIYIIGKLKSLSDKFENNYDNFDNWLDLDFLNLFPDFQDHIELLSKKSQNSVVYVWGASTKGCLFINHCQRIDPFLSKKISAAIDINPAKSNKYLPGTDKKIISVEQYEQNAMENDIILVTNPNYFAEISLAAHKINPGIKCINI